MDYETILYELSGGVATITLNRPDKMNALTSQMRAELAHAVKRAGQAGRVVVLTGAGKAFCSGQDLGQTTGGADALELERLLRDEYEPIVRAIVEAPVPVISAVNGPAAGAGANIALAADVVIACQSAYFLQAFSKIGLIPDAGGTYVLPRQIGLARAMGAALFAEKISAAQAADWGMIWEAVDDADFEAHWHARADYLAQGPTLAYRGIKDTMRASLGNSLDTQLEMEAQVQGKCGTSRDAKEGILSFLEKRSPDFEGR